jgi:phospholipase C
LGVRRADGRFPLDGFIQSAGGDAMVMNYNHPADVPITDFLARNFCVCNRWFAPLPAGTQPNRLMAMSGYSRIDINSSTLIPNQNLVYDWLSAHKVPWRVYHQGVFPFFSLMLRWMEDVAGGDRFRRFERFALDFELEPDSTFAPVIFLEPVYTNAPHSDDEGTDDHAPSSVIGGQHFVLDAYRALVANPKRWSRTVMVLTYDEHGGFFDHVQPRKFSDGHYSSEVDGRSVGNVADALDLAQPRTDIPQAPDPSVIPTPQGSAAPPPSTNNNVKAFTAAAQQMRRQYAYQLAAKFPEQRKIILGH